jgi:hypothetical protein
MKNLVFVLLVILFSAELIMGQTGAKSWKHTAIYISRPGLMNISELNVGFGLGDTNADFAKQFVGLTTILGYGITRYLHGGIGAGLSFYNEGMLVPLFLDLRYVINFRKISAYFFGDGGGLFSFSKTGHENKLLLNPGTGLRFKICSDLDFNIGAGLFLQVGGDQSRDRIWFAGRDGKRTK